MPLKKASVVSGALLPNRAFWKEARGLVADGVRFSRARLGQGAAAGPPRGGEYGAVDVNDGAASSGGPAPARGGKSERRSGGDKDWAKGSASSGKEGKSKGSSSKERKSSKGSKSSKKGKHQVRT